MQLSALGLLDVSERSFISNMYLSFFFSLSNQKGSSYYLIFLSLHINEPPVPAMLAAEGIPLFRLFRFVKLESQFLW